MSWFMTFIQESHHAQNISGDLYSIPFDIVLVYYSYSTDVSISFDIRNMAKRGENDSYRCGGGEVREGDSVIVDK